MMAALPPHRSRWIHGPVRPMHDDPPSWRSIGLAAIATAAIIAFTWLAIPALAEWTIGGGL